MQPTELEILESIDMLRIIENGYKVYLAETKEKSQSVDTEADLRRVNDILNGNE